LSRVPSHQSDRNAVSATEYIVACKERLASLSDISMKEDVPLKHRLVRWFLMAYVAPEIMFRFGHLESPEAERERESPCRADGMG
jgi:hypothetical protein